MRTTRAVTATPTYRAGANLHDPAGSGFARVDILKQQDLFPHEGLGFKNTGAPIQTRTYKVSDDSPFNCTCHQKMIRKQKEDKEVKKQSSGFIRSERLCTQAAVTAIKTPTPGELRHLNSQIVSEAVRKERLDQMRANEKVRVARMKDDAYWSDVERSEGVSTGDIGRDIARTRHMKQRALADDYKEQFRLHDKAKAEEKRLEDLEVMKMRQMEREDAEKEKRRQAGLRVVAQERLREFQLRNDELLQRKEKKREDDIQEERIVQKQQAENVRRMEQREAAQKMKRDEMNRVRENIVQRQAVDHEQRLARQRKNDAVAESETERRAIAEREARLKKQRDIAAQRNRDWIDYQKNRDSAYADRTDTPDWDNAHDDDCRRADAKFRANRAVALRKQLGREIDRHSQQNKADTDLRHQQVDNMYVLKDNEW